MALLNLNVRFDASLENLINIDKAIARGVLRPAFKKVEKSIEKEFKNVFATGRSDKKWKSNNPKYVKYDKEKKSNEPLVRTGRTRDQLTNLTGSGVRVRRGNNYISVRPTASMLKYLNFSLRGKKNIKLRRVPIRDPFASMVTARGRIKKPFKDLWEGYVLEEIRRYVSGIFSASITQTRRR